MNKASKIIVTIIVIFIFFLIFGIIVGSRGDAGHSTPGIFGIIVFAGLYGAIRAIWKKKKDNDDENSVLQK